MRPAEAQQLIYAAFAVIGSLVFSSCGTGPSARALPPYEPQLAKTDFQNVRTTAYTHTESDHRQYGARNALGGQLRAAGPAIHRAENVARALSVSDTEDVGIQRVSNSGSSLQPFSLDESRTTTRAVKGSRASKRAVAARKRPKIGSAAADWARWPAGTTFRLLSTGQIYRVDDYGWALSGRNTIDLYMATRGEMNNWGTRQEPIQILRWGDPEESLRFLAPRQQHPHLKRMVLELQGRDQEAAAMR